MILKAFALLEDRSIPLRWRFPDRELTSDLLDPSSWARVWDSPLPWDYSELRRQSYD